MFDFHPAMRWLAAAGAALAVAAGSENATLAERRAIAEAAYDTCTIQWSELYWDQTGNTHYFHVTNNCNRTVHCYVKVTRNGRTTTYGWNVDGGHSHRIAVGIISRGDHVERGAT